MQFVLIDIDSCISFYEHQPHHESIVTVAIASSISYDMISSFDAVIHCTTPSIEMFYALPGEISLILGAGHRQSQLSDMLKSMGHAVYNICSRKEMATIMGRLYDVK
jgi:hypothetical protein